MQDPSQNSGDNRETNVIVNGSANTAVNGNSVVSTNGSSNGSVNGKVNGKVNGQVNGKISAGLNGKTLSIYYGEKSFSFSVDVPKNVVVRVVDILGIETDRLVDDLTLPGRYVVMLDKEKNNPGLYYYKLFVEIEDENETDFLKLHDKPGKKYCLLETKEVLIT